MVASYPMSIRGRVSMKQTLFACVVLLILNNLVWYDAYRNLNNELEYLMTTCREAR